MSSNHNTRRSFIKKAGTTIGGGVITPGFIPASASAKSSFRNDDFSRAKKSYDIRMKCAVQNLEYSSNLASQPTNQDLYKYKDQNFYASFTKALPSNDFGEVNPYAFRKLLKALTSQNDYDFERIPLDDLASRKLANPQGAFRHTVDGLDGHSTRILPSHAFNSAELAAEAGEIYWQAITRDIPFNHYESSKIIEEAVTDLRKFSSIPNSKLARQLTPNNLFRGNTEGDLTGPYISQFL